MENQVLDNELTGTGTQPRWAGFWIRTGATLIDALAYSPLIGLNMYNLYTLKNLPLQLVLNLVMFLYKPFMEYKYSATLGKMAVKIKVTDENFNNINLQQAVVRYTPWIISQVFTIYTTVLLFQHPAFAETTGMRDVGQLQNSLVPPYFSILSSGLLIVSIIVVIFNSRKQSVHDMMAKTYVVYK
jgi:uncharacterized RDD family membrane protein YckC